MSKTLLHVGCGRKTDWAAQRLMEGAGLSLPTADDYRVVTLDASGDLGADHVCRLGLDRLPLPDDSVDLVYAWHVLEHVGTQGETDAWFFCWEELYRVLKADGLVVLSSPYYDSIWAWSDPTHTRVISEHSFAFFDQRAYRVPGSMISPYRVRCDFQMQPVTGIPKGWDVLRDQHDPRSRSLRAVLRAIKPLQPWWEDQP
jgi:SAM-dependent methyltransferase